MRTLLNVVCERAVAVACGVACALTKDVLCLLDVHVQNVSQGHDGPACHSQQFQLNCVFNGVCSCFALCSG
jgi:hypothetical protein